MSYWIVWNLVLINFLEVRNLINLCLWLLKYDFFFKFIEMVFFIVVVFMVGDIFMWLLWIFKWKFGKGFGVEGFDSYDLLYSRLFIGIGL